jgi:hypothetical protein
MLLREAGESSREETEFDARTKDKIISDIYKTHKNEFKKLRDSNPKYAKYSEDGYIEFKGRIMDILENVNIDVLLSHN